MRLRTPRLDFIVIGAQKAGTTSLWRYLDDHPRLRTPPDKEAPIFSEADYSSALRGYMRALFGNAPARAKLGTVTPTYMLGAPGAPPALIAERIAAAVPEVKLVALLRDPVERARSHHRMSVRRGWERRPFEAAIVEELDPDRLQESRHTPTETNTYVTAGEYGRVLAAYLERFDRDQLHVELTVDLERDAAAVVRRVCEFVGVRPHDSRALGGRFHVSGGRPRVPADAEAELKGYLRQNAWARMRHADQHEDWFNRWFEMWNVEPEPVPEGMDEATERRLREHFASDTRRLADITGLTLPWDRT